MGRTTAVNRKVWILRQIHMVIPLSDLKRRNAIHCTAIGRRRCEIPIKCEVCGIWQIKMSLILPHLHRRNTIHCTAVGSRRSEIAFHWWTLATLAIHIHESILHLDILHKIGTSAGKHQRHTRRHLCLRCCGRNLWLGKYRILA